MEHFFLCRMFLYSSHWLYFLHAQQYARITFIGEKKIYFKILKGGFGVFPNSAIFLPYIIAFKIKERNLFN